MSVLRQSEEWLAARVRKDSARRVADQTAAFDLNYLLLGDRPGCVASELALHRDFIAWCRKAGHPELLYGFHCPNGERRTARTGAKLRAMGVLPGVSDFLLLVPRGGYCGLLIEFKAPGERVEPGGDQDRWLRYQITQRYAVAVVDDLAVARSVVERYLRRET